MNRDGSIRSGFDDALSAWAGDPMLAAPLADVARVYLVLDGDARQILHASTAAGSLARAVSDGGALAPGLSAQIRAVGAAEKPRLARLRLDPRRIAPPTPCLIARGGIDGSAALLLLVAGPVPAFRPRTVPRDPGSGKAEAAAGTMSEPTPRADPAAPAAGDRFVWRSDAEDRLTAISGSCAAVIAPILVGRRWAALAQDGRLTAAEALLAALGERRTFRAAPAALNLDAASVLTIEMSGARLGRGGEAFSGFGGYGVVRALTIPAAFDPTPPQVLPELQAAELQAAELQAAEPEPGALPSEDPAAGLSRSDVPAPEAPALTALPDVRSALWPPALLTVARFGQAWTSNEAASRRFQTGSPPASPTNPAHDASSSAEPPGSAAALPVAGTTQPAPVEPPAEPPAVAPGMPEVPDASLSVTEHAAFREIARALGARYAGDDAGSDAPDEPGATRVETGAVMPFPVTRPVESAPESLADAATLLADLPTAVLIYRGDAVLAANPRLLALTGHADLASLRDVGLGRLFRGLPPDLHGADASRKADRVLLIETAGGGSRPVAVAHGLTTWQGEPADCLILRPLPEADPAGAHAAELLARTFRDGHAADARATLDALDDGLVTLDPAGRIVAMNRAAAVLFGCDPREVVGTGFDALFETSGRDAVRAGVADPGTETRTVTAGGRPLALRVSGHGGTRVAVLRPASDEPAQAAPPVFDRPAFLGRLDREIRAPVEGIVGLADEVLAEPHGPIDERDRVSLRAIKAAGAHVSGLVGDLVDLATIEAGGLVLAVRPLPLNDLVSGCVERLQAEAARGRIVLRTSFSPDLAPMEADEPTLRRAALTVIANAIRATGAGGQVIVSTAPGERGGAALKIRGTGPGMSAEEIASALEPLGAGRGTGLGLPLSKALVEANHGHLRISSHKDEGTLVEILLPGSQTPKA